MQNSLAESESSLHSKVEIIHLASMQMQHHMMLIGHWCDAFFFFINFVCYSLQQYFWISTDNTKYIVIAIDIHPLPPFFHFPTLPRFLSIRFYVCNFSWISFYHCKIEQFSLPLLRLINFIFIFVFVAFRCNWMTLSGIKLGSRIAIVRNMLLFFFMGILFHQLIFILEL